MQDRILELLSTGPIQNRDEARAQPGARHQERYGGTELDALIVRREIVSINGKGYVLDSPAARRGRVVRAVRNSQLWKSHADIAKGAHVDPAVVLEAIRDGARSDEGRYIAP